MIENHEKIALSFSGGKDSTACVYLLRDHLDRMTVYHVDTGDYLPETIAVVAEVERMVPHFVRIKTDALAWTEQYGLPSDLVPYGSHPIGRACGQATEKLVSRYDCCFANVMWPLYERVKADGCTLLIRGTKAADVPVLPVGHGAVMDGIELWYPIQAWSDSDVLAYLDEVGAPRSRVYDYGCNSVDCARCSGWWTEGRGAYLKQHHPALFVDYKARLTRVQRALAPVLRTLENEGDVVNG